MKSLSIILILLISLNLFGNKETDIFIEINDKYESKVQLLNDYLLKNIEEKDEFKFFIKSTTKGLTDVTYYKFGYKYKDILVDKQSLVISVKNDIPFLLSGYFLAPKEISQVKFSSGDVINNFKNSVDNFIIHEDAKKVFIMKDDKVYLAYKALIEYTDKTGWKLGIIYFDVKTGEKITFHSHIYNAVSNRVYDMKSRCLSTQEDYDSLPGQISSHPNYPSVKSAYTNSSLTYWFYKHMFNRESLDNQGIRLRSSINVRFLYSYNQCSDDNAAFVYAPYNQMAYGSGGNNYYYFSRGLDVVAHELTHGVTVFTSQLIYQNESGALNEAISDIFGSTIEAWNNSGGDELGNPNEILSDNKTWKIGEDISVSGLPIRYMNDPRIVNEQNPDHYNNIYRGSEDNGGVHINSGIINLVYYLLVVGGEHPRLTLPNRLQRVNGINMDKSIRIFYEAQVGLLVENTNFTTIRSLISQAAENLYGSCSNESEQVNRAFDLVGIPGERKDSCKITCDKIDCSSDTNSYCFEGKHSFCKCNDGYYNTADNSTCIPIEVCHQNSCLIDNKKKCSIIDNKISCSCDLRTNYEDQLGNCIEKPNCSNEKCNDHGYCKIDIQGLPKCVCYSGYINQGNLMCVLNKEKACKEIACTYNQNCIIKDDKAVCSCNSGYYPLGTTCVKDKRASLCNGVTCNNHGVCIVLENEEVTCDCNDEYYSKGLECLKREVKENSQVSNEKSNSSGCDYNSNSNNSYLLFTMMGLLIFIIRKREKKL